MQKNYLFPTSSAIIFYAATNNLALDQNSQDLFRQKPAIFTEIRQQYPAAND
jgi:hypothetical protein